MVALLWCVAAQAAEAVVIVGDEASFHAVRGLALETPLDFAYDVGDEVMWRRLEALESQRQVVAGVGVGAGAGALGTGLFAAMVANAAGNQDVALVALGVAGTGLGVAATSAFTARRMRSRERDLGAWYSLDGARAAAAQHNAAWDLEAPQVTVEDGVHGYTVRVDGRSVDAPEAALRLGDVDTWRRLGRRQFALSMTTWGSAHAMTVLGTVALARAGWGGGPFLLGATAAFVGMAVAASPPRRLMPHQVWTEEEARALARSVSAEP